MNEELQIAWKKARSLPEQEVPAGAVFIGEIKTKNDTFYFYKSESEYFYESESGKQFNESVKEREQMKRRKKWR